MNLGRTLVRLNLANTLQIALPTLLWVVLLLIPLLAPSLAQAQQQRVDVQLSTNRVSVDESVILNVRAYGMDKEIDYSALNANFDVTQRSSSRQVTIENGKRTSLVEWVLELIPKQTGALEIPPITVGSEQSRTLTVLVEPSPTGSNRDVYLEASVDIEDPFVQAQVIYTLRVFQDIRFIDASLQVPEVDGVVLQQLTQDKSYEETVNGRNYVVREIRYAVFPQRSGTVVVPPIALQAVVPVDRQQVPNSRIRTKRVTRRSNQIELNVRARPEGLDVSWWLPAKEVQLQSEWSEPIDNLSVDQPLTRTIHLMATGVGDSQLPELAIPAVENISVYADSPVATTNASEKGLISQQTNSWAVIPQTAGMLTMPEVRVSWFDTTTGEARVATLPEEVLTVRSSANAVANNVSQTDADSSQPGAQQANAETLADTDALSESLADNALDNTGQSGNREADQNQGEAAPLSNVGNQPGYVALLQSVDRWRNIAYGLIAGWALTLIGVWLWLRRRTVAVNDSALSTDKIETASMRFQRRAGSNASLASIRAACDNGDAADIAKALLAWGAMVWPEKPPTNTIEIATRLNSKVLEAELRVLDAQQFRPSGSVKTVASEAIPTLLKQAVDQYQAADPSDSPQNALPSL